MKSFRYQFIDIDSSVTVVNTASPIKGFMVCRAPKGTAEAMYFAPGSEVAINSMIGLQTANWPDVYEAVQFNQQYGLYISAPPGTSSDYSSYYGGVYLTTKGQYKFWREQDIENLTYNIQIYPGSESVEYDNDCTDSEIDIVKINVSTENGKSQGYLKIAHVAAPIMQKTSYITFEAWENKAASVDEGQEVQYHLVNGKVFPVVEGVDAENAIGYYELNNEGTYDIYLGVTGISTDSNGQTVATSATNTETTTGVPYLDFNGLFDYSLVATAGDLTKITDQNTFGTNKVGEDLLEYILLNGAGDKFQLFSDTEGTKKSWYSPFKGLKDRIFFNVNLKSETYLALAQKSCYETPTHVTISNIGYDKYRYDLNIPYILESTFVNIRDKNTDLENYADGPILKDLMAANAEGLICGIKTEATNEDDPNGEWVSPVSPNMLTIWKYSTVSGLWNDVTADYKTKTIYLEGPLMSSKTHLPYASNATVDGGCKYSLWYVEDAGKAEKYKNSIVKEVEGGTYEPQYDINYNTLTISCREEVYPGAFKSGGTFTGSLSDTGKDSTGGNIYWPNILPKDTITFLDIIPVHTFDELGCVNEKGFYTAKKLVDPIGPAQDVEMFSIVGQRYCTHLNQENVNKGMLGCAWADGYTPIINEGLDECMSTEYDDAYVIMEPTGQEQFKSKLMVLRTTYHDLSTVISPKIITAAELSSPSTITVAGRSKGTAQYIGEFKLYDSYTGKYWWCQPIGDIGAMLCRIIERKLGGVSPAGTNDSDGLGGVLGRAVLAAKWKFQDSALEILDSKGLNPITYDADHGLMIQSGKSTQDPAQPSDWSYLGHSMSFDLCKREIRDKVMVAQVHKRISPHWFKIREKQVQDILDKRTTGKDPIWSYASVDITGQNNGTTAAQRKFMILVQCRVYTFSDIVVLMFENLPTE